LKQLPCYGLLNSSGSLTILTAIRRASSRVPLHAVRLLEIQRGVTAITRLLFISTQNGET
jgi:hypothetical protein